MAVDLAEREGKILLSFAVLAELFEVLHRKRFRVISTKRTSGVFLPLLRERPIGFTWMSM
jgi:hypothetical protein